MALIEDLNPSDQELIKSILRKDAGSWSENDKAVLRARASYLDKETLDLIKKPVENKATVFDVTVEDKQKEAKKKVFGSKETKVK